MCDDVHSIEASVPRERGNDLLRSRPAAVEHDRLDLRSQFAENRLEVGD
ncbi:hypothetical protein X740_21760 [Mesorhizobium sp. LNHC221B00]|nr:hypothetical protein X740_21760 [Mesorhizobium sp. LNHC221B00]